MGTLLNQPIRDRFDFYYDHLIGRAEFLIETSKGLGITLDQLIEIVKTMEMERQNDLYVSNGDIHDEQMSGIGEIGNSIIGLLIDIKHTTP